jgi:hypothetical protein
MELSRKPGRAVAARCEPIDVSFQADQLWPTIARRDNRCHRWCPLAAHMGYIRTPDQRGSSAPRLLGQASHYQHSQSRRRRGGALPRVAGFDGAIKSTSRHEPDRKLCEGVHERARRTRRR